MNGLLQRSAVLVTSALVALTLAGAVVAAKDDLDVVSVASGPVGAMGDESSFNPAISADGRFVAFRSNSTNLDPADADTKADIFERDLKASSTKLVSRATGVGGAKGNNDSLNAAVSADGRFVAFDSAATNLDPADGDADVDVFVRDLQTDTTTLVSRASGADGVTGNGPSSSPAISADGRFVAFESASTNLTADNTADVQVFVRDLQANTTTLVSRASGAAGALADGVSSSDAISADGRFVAFSSRATNLDPGQAQGDPELGNVFVRDLQANTTTLVSRATGASGAGGNRDSGGAAISTDGRYVAFVSFASNLTPDEAGLNGEVFLRDRQQNTTVLVSRATGAAGAEADSDSRQPTISGDGRFVAFQSDASNLDPADGNTGGNIFERDLQANTTTLVSRAAGAAGAVPNFFSLEPTISADGRFVAFFSAAQNLVPGGNGSAQVFRRDVLGPAEPPALISIGDANLPEGNTGQTALRFTVSLDRTESDPVSVAFSTSNGSATAPGDYSSTNGRLTFSPGETAKTVTVQVNGDLTVEPDETLNVNLSSATGKATIADSQGVGTIRNDDQQAAPPPPPTPAQISIADVRQTEGNSGRTRFRFRISLDRAEQAPVNVTFVTANRTAKAPRDYAVTSGVASFEPGETSKTITVLVKGDRAREPNETFRVNLTNRTGQATIARGRAVGTILNDDRKHARPDQR